MAAKIEARATHQCASTPEAMYDAWLDPAKVRVWLAAALRKGGLPGDLGAIEIDARVGGRFLFTDRRTGGLEARHWGTYLELDRPNRIAFTWIVDESEEADPSRVTIAFAHGRVTLVHELDAAWADYVPRTEASWSRMLRASDSASPSAA